MAPADGEDDADDHLRPPESGRLKPSNLAALSTGDYIRAITDDTDQETPRAEHNVGDGDLYCVTEVAYRRETPDVYVKPVAEPGEWPEEDAPSYVIVSTEYGVTLAKEGPDELEAVQPVDAIREVSSS